MGEISPKLWKDYSSDKNLLFSSSERVIYRFKSFLTVTLQTAFS